MVLFKVQFPLEQGAPQKVPQTRFPQSRLLLRGVFSELLRTGGSTELSYLRSGFLQKQYFSEQCSPVHHLPQQSISLVMVLFYSDVLLRTVSTRIPLPSGQGSLGHDSMEQSPC